MCGALGCSLKQYVSPSFTLKCWSAAVPYHLLQVPDGPDAACVLPHDGQHAEVVGVECEEPTLAMEVDLHELEVFTCACQWRHQ